ncbi:MAG: hypothetical protein A3C81_00980 [Candidatus Yanofskybacteria bacterium RIFCSPHIGHO2_02_FULL_46_19]|uniref:DUF1573 domain-containing protein n=3 Tax=Candidatus Yanofskyibacteriota TaxID=1752733 RepID=A0A1F8FSI8_9BACT|nr:MAG: hypothetical protein A3C81_00980 [Candidatus Yanofskybacteria bacterium RIFCSPHIGHO2_02_FULL_46_19]
MFCVKINYKIMAKYKNTIYTTLAIVLFLGGLIWLANSGAPKSDQQQTELTNPADGGALSAAETSYDFGTVPMSKGKVTHIFKVTNSSAGPVIVSKLYTSCMCTEASLITEDKRLGPFGMPGHGFVPSIKGEIRASGSADVEVVFDPAAHGPAGVGRIDRVVYLEEKSGNKLELQFTAMVTP